MATHIHLDDEIVNPDWNCIIVEGEDNKEIAGEVNYGWHYARKEDGVIVAEEGATRLTPAPATGLGTAITLDGESFGDAKDRLLLQNGLVPLLQSQGFILGTATVVPIT